MADPVEVFIDYHCPYCHRAVGWLERLPQLGADVHPRYRWFPLEQVNRDPAATEWRLWEQPLDYEHHAGRRDRRSLPAMLATAVLAATEPPATVAAFRSAVFRARFEAGGDISDPVRLVALADDVGADAARLGRVLSDGTATAGARRTIEADWRAARSEFATFGVPTLRLPGASRPWYVRLERHVDDGEALALWQRLSALVTESPALLELKAPDRIVPA